MAAFYPTGLFSTAAVICFAFLTCSNAMHREYIFCTAATLQNSMREKNLPHKVIALQNAIHLIKSFRMCLAIFLLGIRPFIMSTLSVAVGKHGLHAATVINFIIGLPPRWGALCQIAAAITKEK